MAMNGIRMSAIIKDGVYDRRGLIFRGDDFQAIWCCKASTKQLGIRYFIFSSYKYAISERSLPAIFKINFRRSVGSIDALQFPPKI